MTAEYPGCRELFIFEPSGCKMVLKLGDRSFVPHRFNSGAGFDQIVDDIYDRVVAELKYDPYS